MLNVEVADRLNLFNTRLIQHRIVSKEVLVVLKVEAIDWLNLFNTALSPKRYWRC